jgi:L-seryl-tRNA(Ser) seleniumtransferase
MNNNRLRELPAVNDLLEQSERLIEQYGHDATADAIRRTIDETRQAILTGAVGAPTDDSALLARAAQALKQQFTPSLRPVINATGVIIHTNLGRAPLSDDARAAVEAVARDYNTLEFDLDSGGRGSRNAHAEGLLPELAGAEAALIVNNAASALVLILTALASGREVVVSRGQLVEIGGGFRIPEIMVQGGAHLVEVGTTNKTRPDDYRRAITDNTAMLLRVHASNFKQMGFTQSVSIDEMGAIAHEGGVRLVDDVGSGALLDTAPFGLAPEPLVQDSIAAGADLVLFSGDKLLGGPQAGVIVGKRDAVDVLKRHPFSRALRADKMALAALTATLEHYRRGEALEKVPVWWMMNRKLCDLGRIAKRWQKQLPHAEIQKGESTVGGGSVPGSTLPTVLLALDVPGATDFARRLRGASPPVIARIQEGRVLLDPRTVFPHQEDTLLEILHRLLE